ncbi:RNA transcription, translation and transport factor protein-like [Artemia franciscana]|uniref:RNA transcription, translation and transport factor protein-like n=1 Tax=Artemia franciscana TaxID=6661 RepID=UPI0032DBED74
MFERKLNALNCFLESFNPADEDQFRSVILWLEDQKIRQYKIEEREGLRDVKSSLAWSKSYEKYLEAVGCPSFLKTRNEQLDWLLCLAIKLVYQEKSNRYSGTIEGSENKFQGPAKPSIVPTNPLDNMDFESQDFKNGVKVLAGILNVGVHPDHLVTLEAVARVINVRLSTEVLKNPGKFSIEGTPYPFAEADLGFDTGDPALNQASKVLRLLFISDLRDLQTKINECIVGIQRITANPKTDTALGKVGY